MNENSPPALPSPTSPPRGNGMKVLGILFIVFWLVGHGVWATLAFMANAMANGSGAASAESQITSS